MKNWPYEDIVNMPHHVSGKHAPMPMIRRAAQFAPFAALTGYEDAVRETARLTDSKMELSDTQKEDLNRRLTEAVTEDREVTVTYFVPDARKNGGSYIETTGRIIKVRPGAVLLDTGKWIAAEDIMGIVQRSVRKKMREQQIILIAVMMMPTYEGDHMSLQGGMTKWNDIRPFYLELAEMIDALPR